MAVVMALLLKYFIVEAYKIPTGSMQPTLIGDDASGIKDRILVDKLSYVFRDPMRWDVAVFRYPLNRSQNFVKRIVGVGPEQLRIRFGDIWRRSDASEEWSVVRRPRGVMQTIWKRLDLEAPEGTSWKVQEAPGDWELAGRSIRSRGDGRASFRGPASVVDLYLDGYPERLIPFMPDQHRKSGANTVGDLRVAGTVAALPDTEAVLIELEEGERRYRFRIPGPAASEGARTEIHVEHLGTWSADGESSDSGQVYRLPPNRAVAFAAQNLDDRLP
jgi:signal peptidase I